MRRNTVYFIAGFSPRKGLLGVAAFLHELEGQDVEFTRFFMTRDGQWANREFNEDIVSVSYTREGDDWSWWLLNKRGKVISSSPKGRFEEVIPDAGTGSGRFGYLSDLRLINGTLYAAGVGRQVYRRVNAQWSRFDGGIRTASTTVGFRAIDGLGEDSIHAVGYGGGIWYFDGNRWEEAASPTNMTLEAVRMVSPNLCYVCGKSGTILRGFKDSWELIHSEVSQNFWAVEFFKNRVYLASTKGLFTIEGDVLEPMDVGRKVEGRRLYSNSDEMWSVEHHELWVFDGLKWQEVICPDNATVS
jgi:hypothetical protein